MFALTFDDGPGPSTEALLDVLLALGVPATFFLLGRNVEEAPWCGDPGRARAIAQRARSEGHVLGNHTYSHLRPDRWREFTAGVRRGEAVLRLLRSGAIPFRLPYGIQRVAGGFPLGSAGDQMDPRLSVIATSIEPFYRSVETGLFSDGLYYRLNTVTVLLDRQPATVAALGFDARRGPHGESVNSAPWRYRPAASRSLV